MLCQADYKGLQLQMLQAAYMLGTLHGQCRCKSSSEGLLKRAAETDGTVTEQMVQHHKLQGSS